MLNEFKGFLLKTNALALAVGVIIGVRSAPVVTSLVNDIIMPPIGMGPRWCRLQQQLKMVLKDAAVATRDRGRDSLGHLPECDLSPSWWWPLMPCGRCPA